MKSLLILLVSGFAQAALITGGVSGVTQDVGTSSRGSYVEIVDASGNVQGKTKTFFSLTAINFTPTTSDAMVTLTPTRDHTAGSTGTSFAVTSGKKMVLLGWCISTKNAGAAVQGVQARIRISTSGAVTTATQAEFIIGAGTVIATANVVGGLCSPISQGWPTVLEISGNMQVGVSVIGTNTAGADISIWGYEY